MSNENKIKESAKNIRGYHLTKRAMAIGLGAIFLLVIITYIVSVMYSKAGAFTITVQKMDSVNYSIALSETREGMKSPRSNLTCPAVKEVTNIAGSSLDYDQLGKIDGVANGENYLCYTFYLYNNGELGVDVDYSVSIANQERNLDAAVRIVMIDSRNNAARNMTTYAKASYVNQQTHESVPEDGTVCFEDLYTVTKGTIQEFWPDEFIKYTVVLYLEGNDPDCSDDVKEGSFKLDMKFNVSKVHEKDEH